MISTMNNNNDVGLDRKARGGSEENNVVFGTNGENRVWHGDDEMTGSKANGAKKGEKVDILDENVGLVDEKIGENNQSSDGNGRDERLEVFSFEEDAESTPRGNESRISVHNGKIDQSGSRVRKRHAEVEKSNASHHSMPSVVDEFASDGKGEVVENPPGYGYEIGDMVWGKVKSHPWWPGHIYSEAFASPSVRRSKREGHVLVAFFGDSSYGWFDPAELVPFDSNFSEKSRQTTLRNFVRAVEEAVDEASRRRALGLVCRCRNPYNFRPTNVQGYFAVDVGDYEPGTVYSADQIRKSRESFQPKEMLAFIKQVALSPTRIEHGSIGFIKNKAAVLAYRKAIYEEFDETYAQAFGHEPVRPSRGKSQDVVPIRAPLSGPLVIAEALGKGKGSARANKSKDQAKKDQYLFKQRVEPNESKTSFQTNLGQAISSAQPVILEDSLPTETDDYVLQKRCTLVTGKEDMTMDEKPADVELTMTGFQMDESPAASKTSASVGVRPIDFKAAFTAVKNNEQSVGYIDFKTAFTPVKNSEQSVSQAAKIESGATIHTDNIAGKKAKKISKHPVGESNSENSSIPLEKKKKRKKELAGPQGMQMRPAVGKGGPEASSEDFQVEHQKKEDNKVIISSSPESELKLPNLLHDLQTLALDPFHHVDQSPEVIKRVFLRFRSLVYQKSLASLGPTDSESNESRPNKPPVTTENVREFQSVKLQRSLVRADDPTKGERKRGPSDRQEEMSLKKKKKINDVKILKAEKKGVQKIPESSPAMKVIKSTPIKKPEGPSRVPEPTMLVMKFPPQGTLPSSMELKARFARFGQLDHSATRIFWKTSTCRVVYRYKVDAQSAYRFAINNNLFGNAGVRCFLRDVAEAESSKAQREEASSMGPLPVERRPVQTLQQPGNQLKSILKKSNGDETTGGNGGRGPTPRVKFMLGGEEENNMKLNRSASFADGGGASSTSHGKDLNTSKKNIPPPSTLPPILPLPATTATTSAVQFTKLPPNKMHYSEVAPPPPRNASHNFKIPAGPPALQPLPPSAPNKDVSEQMMSLLRMNNDVVTNLTVSLGYKPYHPL